ncbi:MAG: VIT1/CCC1 transporter family protein [Candidatus Pacebacteria bacterium]|nr:VIT1/CCC1 transporter family protein [Candidatus Paceibacterota bacterium]
MSFKPQDQRFTSTLVCNIEEGLVLTVGLLSGIAIAGISGATIVLVGTIFVFTAGVSAAAKYMLTRMHESEAPASITPYAQESLMIALFYIVAGIIPLLPYMLIDVSRAFTASIVCSFAAAFVLGLWSGHTGRAVWKSAYHMAYVAAGGAIIGAIVNSVL